MIRGAELIVSFMTLTEIRQGALDANWGRRMCDVLEAYLADFSVLHSDSLLCSTWAAEGLLGTRPTMASFFQKSKSNAALNA
jgi:hypothetical protein